MRDIRDKLATTAGINYDELDPGIRETVRWFRERGFDTTDSGDGVAKLELINDGCALPMPHVFIRVDPTEMRLAANTIAKLLEQHGVNVGQVTDSSEADVVSIQLTYDPSNDVAMVGVYGLNDEMMARAVPNRPSRGGRFL
jgi:hypothetical protein